MNRKNKMQNPKIIQKTNEIKMPRKFLTLKYFFFFIRVNNVILLINIPNDMEAFYTLSSVVYNGVFWDTMGRTRNNNYIKPNPEQNTLKTN